MYDTQTFAIRTTEWWWLNVLEMKYLSMIMTWMDIVWNEEVCISVVMERVLPRRVDLRFLSWLGHIERWTITIGYEAVKDGSKQSMCAGQTVLDVVWSLPHFANEANKWTNHQICYICLIFGKRSAGPISLYFNINRHI